MRYLGIDLGTTSCGIALTDKTNTISYAKEPIFFNKDDYSKLYLEILKIIKDNNITDIVIGLPKNMDGSMGFAADRSLNFANYFNEDNVKIHFEDERLTTVEALGIMHFNGKNVKNSKKIIDSVSAQLILESYLKRSKNE